MSIQQDKENIEDFLTRGVEHVYPSADFLRSRLSAGQPLTMYLGIDPTGPTLHLGHAIILRKLRQFQDIGHRVILLIGDFTAMIGDPTDKMAARKRQTRKEVLANAKLYKKQASRFLRFSGRNAATLKWNSKWLSKLTLADTLELASHFTIQQTLARDMFKRRLEEDRPLYNHEFLYPLMQAYDSVAMKVDGEIGGNDQTFNMLAGRTLMKEMLDREKFVITMKLLTDPEGKKMGKSEGNMITLTDDADEVFGKIMSWTDGMIVPGFELLTDVPIMEVREMEGLMKNGSNPKEFKLALAAEVVRWLVGSKESVAARERFEKTFRDGATPEDVPTFPVGDGMELVRVLAESRLVSSKAEARRVVSEGGVTLDGAVVRDPFVRVSSGQIIQKGKRHFLRLV